MSTLPAGILHGHAAVFRAITCAVEPDAAQLRDADWTSAIGIVEGMLAERPATMQRQLRLLLTLLEHGARFRYGRPLTQLDPGQREQWLRSFEKSRVPLLRKGFWGVRTLALMGYYARPEAAEAIGYRASAQGWSARRAAP